MTGGLGMGDPAKSGWRKICNFCGLVVSTSSRRQHWFDKRFALFCIDLAFLVPVFDSHLHALFYPFFCFFCVHRKSTCSKQRMRAPRGWPCTRGAAIVPRARLPMWLCCRAKRSTTLSNLLLPKYQVRSPANLFHMYPSLRKYKATEICTAWHPGPGNLHSHRPLHSQPLHNYRVAIAADVAAVMTGAHRNGTAALST